MFINPDGTFEAEANGSPVTEINPLTGTTYAFKFAGAQDLYVNPAATIAAFTIKLPQAEAGRELDIVFTQIITTLAIQDALGVAVVGAPTAATVGLAVSFRRMSPNRVAGTAAKWIKWR